MNLENNEHTYIVKNDLKYHVFWARPAVISHLDHSDYLSEH